MLNLDPKTYIEMLEEKNKELKKENKELKAIINNFNDIANHITIGLKKGVEIDDTNQEY